MTIKQAIDQYIVFNKYDKSLTHSTTEYQRYALGAFRSFLPIRQLNELCPEHIDTYINTLNKRKLSKATVRSRYALIMAFLNYSHDNNYINFNPYAYIKRVRKYRAHIIPVSAKTLKRIIHYKRTYKVRPGFQHFRDKVVLGLIVYGGLRTGEITNLKCDKVNVSSRYIKIVNAKYSNDRLVPIEEPLISLIKDYLITRKDLKSKYFIVGMFRKTKMYRGGVTCIIKKMFASAGIKKRVYGHLLRHSFASMMINAGADINILKTLMGHKSIEMTAMYAKPSFYTIKKTLIQNPMIRYFS